jgi:hypothetical protein
VPLTNGILLATLAIMLVAVAGWVWLWFGLFRPGWRGWAAALAVQLSIVAFSYGVLRSDPISGLMLAAFPPLVLLVLPDFSTFRMFLEQLLWVAGPVTLGVFALCLAIPRMKRFSVAPALLAGLVTMVIVGERVSREAMCREAPARGITTFQRHSLLWSLANVPEEWQFEIHAVAAAEGKSLGWSYREMTWYDIPERAAGNVEDAPDFTCP